MQSIMSSPKPQGDERAAVRMFGRLQLLRLLGKSARTMSWLALEPDGAERIVVLPRAQPGDALVLRRWHEQASRAARLGHPQIAPVVEIGEQDGWPFMLHELRGRATLADRAPPGGLSASLVGRLMLQAARALACAHDGGVAHHDVQRWMLLLDDAGEAQLCGLAAALPAQDARADRDRLPLDRAAAERDLTALGVLAHGLLVGRLPEGETDAGRVADRLVLAQGAAGGFTLRLPRDGGGRQIPLALRSIIDRATETDAQRRYRSARTLLGALEGWLGAESGDSVGALAQLVPRLAAAGALPAARDAGVRTARLARMGGESTTELAEVVLEDLGLSLALLRAVNAARQRGGRLAGSGPLLTVRRAIAMHGMQGLLQVAQQLPPWPGALDPDAAQALAAVVERVQWAGRVAVALRPAAFNAEVVRLVTLLQALGPLVAHHHFPDQALQVLRVCQPGGSATAAERQDPSSRSEAAICAVLGVEPEVLGLAAARWLGVDPDVLPLLRRLPLSTPVRTPTSDDEWLRLLGSVAHEAVEAVGGPPQGQAPAPAALQRVLSRYGRVLQLSMRSLQGALRGMPLRDLTTPGLTAPMGLTQPAPLDTPAPGARA